MHIKINLIIYVVIIILGVISIYYITSNNRAEEKMINLIGLTKEQAEKYANDHNMKLSIEESYSDQDINTVIKQSIKEGTILDDNQELDIVVSKGLISNDELTKYNVNELGRIPVMMYHGIHDKTNDETNYIGGNVDKDGYQRTAEAFRTDLEFYYKQGYRMIRLNDYVDGKIDVELGYSPIILTFDDGLANNIKVTGVDENGEIEIDPNSAIGILEEFKKKYPNYHVTATFFVNETLFNQSEYNDRILNWLIEHGYDIGNHSATHADFTKINYNESIEEIGRVYQLLDEKIPNKYVPIVALPFGSPYDSAHANFPAILKGEYQSINYETKATLRVGWESDYSPFSTSFNPQFIKRIRAYDNNGIDFDIKMNFDRLTDTRFISDGDIDTITIPSTLINELNNPCDLTVRQY